MKKGWGVKTLGEIGKVSMCKRILKKQTTPSGDIPFYKIGTFGKSPNAFIDRETYQNYKAKYSFPKKGDILISASGTIGRRVIYDGEPGYFQDSNIVWIDNNEELVSNDYLYRFYGACDWNPSKGATISRLYNDDLRRIEIPTPPLAEQEAIVEVLDKAFAAIDQAKANIEQNIANAKELFQSKLNQIFSQKGDGWVEDAIENLCISVIDCINKTAPKVDYETDYKMIRTTNVRHGKVALENVKYVTKETYEKWIRRQTPEVGDVLFTREAPLGEAGILKDEAKVFLGQRIVSYRVDAQVLDNHFLLYSFQSPPMQKQIEGLGSGATVQHMRVPDTKKLLVNHPSLKAQKRIVAELTKIDDDCEQIIKVYQTKLDSLDELKKSILQKAFAGELT